LDVSRVVPASNVTRSPVSVTVPPIELAVIRKDALDTEFTAVRIALATVVLESPGVNGTRTAEALLTTLSLSNSNTTMASPSPMEKVCRSVTLAT